MSGTSILVSMFGGGAIGFLSMALVGGPAGLVLGLVLAVIWGVFVGTKFT